MEKINISDEVIAKAKAYVAQGRFKDLNDFISQSLNLMIYAEDNKEKFMEAVKVIPKNAAEQSSV